MFSLESIISMLRATLKSSRKIQSSWSGLFLLNWHQNGKLDQFEQRRVCRSGSIPFGPPVKQCSDDKVKLCKFSPAILNFMNRAGIAGGSNF